MLKKINFVTAEKQLKEMAYGDVVYAWLLLHSHYDETEDHNYIYANEFTYEKIGADIHRTRQTVSKRFKELLPSKEEKEENPYQKFLLDYCKEGKYYIMPCFKAFEKLDAQTVLNLFWLCGQGNTKRKEELIKVYAWAKKKFKEGHKNVSFTEIIEAMGHYASNDTTYSHYKDILTTLQGAGLVKFRTALLNKTERGQFDKTLYIYQVNEKASQEWLDKRREEEKK